MALKAISDTVDEIDTVVTVFSNCALYISEELPVCVCVSPVPPEADAST